MSVYAMLTSENNVGQCKVNYFIFTYVSKQFYLRLVADFTTDLYTEDCEKHKPKYKRR